MRGRLHAAVGGVAELVRRGVVAALGREPGERVEGEDLHRGVVVEAGVVEERDEALLSARDSIFGIERPEQALAERSLLTTAGTAVPRRRGLERRPRRGAPPKCAQDAGEVDAGQRGQPEVAGRLRLLRRQRERRRAGLVIAGLALRAIFGTSSARRKTSTISTGPGISSSDE